ncbi:MAG: flagellar assembly protein FliH [Pseudolabrys sp.]|nr:flagellar assembly protein FliH [Pseudolabrys sp.]
MKATAKYLFDEDFATGEKPTITMVEHERRRADAESQAYRKGFAAAQAQNQAEADQKIAAALAIIGDTLERMSRGLHGVEMRLELEAVQVAVAVARKLAPELIAREPFAEIEALAGDCFRQLVSTPYIGIRISDVSFDSAKQKLDDIAKSRGFEGRLAVTADNTIAPGDCRIEWADGGVVRDRAQTDTAIADVVGRYVAARTAETN